MKIQDYEKVRDLLRSREKLDKLNRIFNRPYSSPVFFVH